MNTQKGFSSLLGLLLFIVLAGGGLYLYTERVSKEIVVPETKEETSTTTSELLKSIPNENKNPIQTVDYTGLYTFSELGEPNSGVVMVYTLDIFKENNTYVAYLNIDGFQQLARMKVNFIQKGNSFSVRLNSYLERNTYSPYKIGDTLFNLDTANPNKMKISWGSMTPAFPVTDSDSTYFEKNRDTILNIDDVRKNIIGKWREVDKSASNASPITFNLDGTYQGSNSKSEYTGRWEILSNLRNERTGDDIQKDVPNGAYLKLSYGEVGPLYYAIEKSDANSLKYIHMSGLASTTIFDLVRMK